MSRRRRRHLGAALGLLAFSALLLLAGNPSRLRREPAPLPHGTPLQRALAGGGEHRFSLLLAAGDAVEVRAEQQGVDVALQLVDPGGRALIVVDGPTWRLGAERLLAVASDAGRHEVVVTALAGEPAGRYTLRLEAPRPASARFRAGAAVAAGLATGTADEPALLHLLAQAHRAGDETLAAEVLERLGRAAARRADWPTAARRWAAAAAGWGRLDQPWREALALPELGFARRHRGNLAGAEAVYRRALPVLRRGGDHRSEAAILQNLADLHQLRGNPEAALVSYRRARRLWREVGAVEREAEVQQSLGVLFQSLGEETKARASFQAAAAGFGSTGNPQRQAESLSRLGLLAQRELRLSAAQELYQRALALHRSAGDRSGEASTLANLALLDREQGRYEAAARRYHSALATLRELGRRSWEAEVLLHLGHLEEVRGDDAAAARHHRQALAIFQELGLARRTVAARVGVARAADRTGDTATALREASRAASAAERLRTAPADPTLRALHFATVQEAFDLQIHLYTERGHHRSAFEVAERARGRALLDLVAGTSAEGEAAPALTLPEIRARLAPTGAAVLAYHLGERASHLWWIDEDGLRHYRLPPRKRLEDLAREAHRLLAVSHRRETRPRLDAILCEASRELLDPVADRLTGRRLWLVADGALALLPFAALPHPAAPREPSAPGEPRSGAFGGGEPGCAGAPPLVASYEIAAVPSASTAAALVARRQRLPAEHLLAVLAVPEALDGLPALPHARREAEAIRSHGRGGPGRPAMATVAIGARPAAQLVRSGRLGSYRIVHFASHALADPLAPSRSGVVVGAGAQGTPVWLRAGEVRHLALHADLVVLSGCRTALGRDLRGEGLLGLAHAFFDAGAASLVVSLWDLQDRSAAMLMDRFYRGLAEHRLPPAAALREAQLELSRDPRWSAPVHWAGLLLQGDGWTEPFRPHRDKESR